MSEPTVIPPGGGGPRGRSSASRRWVVHGFRNETDAVVGEEGVRAEGMTLLADIEELAVARAGFDQQPAS